MKIIHHNDADGRCAAAIVYNFVNTSSDKECIEMDYADIVPFEKIKNNESVFIVDFSLKPEEMEKLLKKTKNVIWIDHHKTAFEYKYSVELEGLRNNDFSGCELAWLYVKEGIKDASKITKDTKISNKVVELIGDYDKWAKKFPDSEKFITGLTIYEYEPESYLWKDLLMESPTLISKYIQAIIEKGEVCIKFRNSFCKDYAKAHGFETKFEGHKCFVMNLYQFGSKAFGSKIDDYDMCISFVFEGKDWQVGLYSVKIDVSKIAKKNGGGGHKGAAGFVCKKLPFEPIKSRVIGKNKETK